MRVGLVCPYDLNLPGGVQRVVLDLAQALLDAGDDVLVVGPGDGPEPSGIPTRLLGPSTSVAGNDSVVPVSLRPEAWRATTEALSGCDLAHVHEPLVPLVGWSALRASTVVATFHADPPPWARTIYRIAAAVSRRPFSDTLVTAVSPTAASAVPPGWGAPRLVPNGVDVGSFQLAADRNPARVAFLGRDEPRKGLDTLLEAWPVIRSLHIGAELEIMGATRDPIPGVRFHGRTSEAAKRQILASSSVFVAPNKRGESFGIVLAEAMAAGCAIVASDLVSFRHVAGDAALYFAPGDSEGLARRVADLVAQPSDARSLGRAALERVARFDWSQVVEGYREVYRDALA